MLDPSDEEDFVRTEYSQYTTTDGTSFNLVGETTYFTDRLGRFAKLVDDEQTASGITQKEIDFNYDAADQLRSIIRTADIGTFRFDTTYDYDNAGRITNISHFRPLAPDPQTPFTSYDYQYDLAHRIVHQETARDLALAAFTGVNALEVEDFSFDLAGQLTDDGNDTFAYDDNGNRDDGSITIDEHNRLTEDADYTYSYDSEGNVTRRTHKNNGSYVEYASDHRNRLVAATPYDSLGQTAGTGVTYQYNADNQLVYRRQQELGVGPFLDPIVIDHYVLDGADRALVFDSETDLLAHRYVNDSITGQLLFDEVLDDLGQQTELLSPAADHLQSTRAILDKSGDIVQTIDYDSFGHISDLRDDAGAPIIINTLEGPVPDTAQLAIHVAHAGSLWDDEAGLYQKGQRFYDPATGRFLNEDPIGFGDGPSQYRFAGNDPVNFRDPTGLTQAGNPLNNLFGTSGGFSGGVVAPAPESTNLSLQQIYGTSPFSSFGSFGTTTIQTPNPSVSVPLAFPNSVVQTSTFQTSGSLQNTLHHNFVADIETNRRESARIRQQEQRLFDSFSGTLVTIDALQNAKNADNGNVRFVENTNTVRSLLTPFSVQTSGHSAFAQDVEFQGENFKVIYGPTARRDGVGPLVAKVKTVRRAFPGSHNDATIANEYFERVESGFAEANRNATINTVLLAVDVATLGRATALKTGSAVAPKGLALEQPRNALGQFARKTGSEVAPGALAERTTLDAIAAKPGWSVARGRVYVRDATGQVRIYDGIATSPSGRNIGIETKSGTGRLTPAQRQFDTRLNSSRFNKAQGFGQSKDLTIQRAIEVRQ